MQLLPAVALGAMFAAPFVLVANETQMEKKKDAMMKEKEPKVVALSQVPGEFEPKKLELEPGRYIFEVTNKSVDHQVALVVSRADEMGKPGDALPEGALTKTLKKGETARSGVVELKAGRYFYYCPFNPTPHYEIVVE